MNIQEKLLEHYGCSTINELQDYLGDFVSIAMIEEFGKLCYNQAIDDAVEASNKDLVRYRKYYNAMRTCTKKNKLPSAKAFHKEYILRLKK